MSAYCTPFGPLPFTLEQAHAVGLTRRQVNSLVARQELRRLVRGVFVDARMPDDLNLRASALGRMAPPGTVVAGRTAAWLWGVDALAMGAHRSVPPVHLMVEQGRSAARRQGVFGSTGPLPDCDVVSLGGVRVTTPARTAADLARLLARPDALVALDALLRRLPLTKDAVVEVLARFDGYRGVRQARELLTLADPRAESPQESRTRLRLIDAGFPPPQLQIVVVDAERRFLARLDLGWEEILRAIEFDGDEHHSGIDALRRDTRRRAAVEALGWAIAVVTSAEILGRGLAFEQGIAELTGFEPRLTRHHPRFGGWDSRGRWAAA